MQLCVEMNGYTKMDVFLGGIDTINVEALRIIEAQEIVKWIAWTRTSAIRMEIMCAAEIMTAEEPVGAKRHCVYERIGYK